MKPIYPLLVLVALAILPALAMGHPPNFDPHHSCLRPYPHNGDPAQPVVVQQTLSYLAPLGTSPLPCQAGDTQEWGSHSPGCGGVGPIPGAYCGPIVPAGGTATCTWQPGATSVPTELVIGFDGLPNGPDGFVRLPQGERPVWGSYPPGPWQVPNPLGVPARVIGFPTNIALPPSPAAGMLAPGDWNWVICVTP